MLVQLFLMRIKGFKVGKSTMQLHTNERANEAIIRYKTAH